MTERKGAVTFKGDPKTLVGQPVAEGDQARDFTLTAVDLSPKKLDDFKGKTVILTTVPSLDTGVCDTMTRRFNEEAGALGDGVAVLTVSMDLPFAQKRWCGNVGAENVITLSDYKDHSFGKAWGLRIEELGLLARSVSVIDPSGKIVYHQLVAEVTEEPDYQAALDAAKRAAS
jgi:thiol peroxidase